MWFKRKSKFEEVKWLMRTRSTYFDGKRHEEYLCTTCGHYSTDKVKCTVCESKMK